jgi:hypothetical protein
MRLFYILFGSVLISGTAAAQTAADYAVELSATVQTAPAQVKLKWKRILFGSPTYTIYKKSKTSVYWGGAIASGLINSDTTYTDNAVIADSAYEYKVFAYGSTVSSMGYIYAGIKAPAIHSRGALILMVDSTFSIPSAAGITRLMQDISGDGWQVIRHDISRSRKDTFVRNIIKADYAAIPNVKAVLLLGHIAVPYSGDFNPDGHPDHKGAWPSDLYYASMTGSWTDVTVFDTAATSLANRNIPGDGKWDLIALPGATQLQVSRIDFYDMPAFSATEVQLMNSYLTKDHGYKMDTLTIRRRALVDDNFGAFSGEAFAANGWRDLPPFVGIDSVSASPMISSLASSSYLWAYACGPGTYTSAGGVGSTSDFAANPVNGIFTMLFGSYFGDWNVQNNFLRAPLCSSIPALTSCWAGRPNWFFHHMVLGENIGYAAQVTQNNTIGLYQPTNFGAGWMHVALMGDLSLRTDYIRQPTNLVIASSFHAGAVLNWTASPDPAVIGYYVYRADGAYGYYKKLSGMLTATTFHDTVGTSGLKYYMVRPVKLQSTPSGGYYNLGIGITDTGTISFSTTTAIASVSHNIEISLYPNPAQNYITVSLDAAEECTASLSIVNAVGESYNTAIKQLVQGNNVYSLNVEHLAPGAYMVCIKTGSFTIVKKWIKL